MFQLYELDGRVYDTFFTLSQYEKLTEEFKKQHDDFIGAKFIFTSSRYGTPLAASTFYTK